MALKVKISIFTYVEHQLLPIISYTQSLCVVLNVQRLVFYWI